MNLYRKIKFLYIELRMESGIRLEILLWILILKERNKIYIYMFLNIERGFSINISNLAYDINIFGARKPNKPQ